MSATRIKPFSFLADCVGFPGDKPGEMINSIKSRATRVSRATFVKNCDLTALKRAKHPLLYRFSAPDNWSLSFWKTTFPSGEPAYYIAWSGIEHVFVRPTFDLEYEETLLASGDAHRNPVDDKVRSARKRHGARAALWGLLTSLYASGRDAEAAQVRDELRRRPQNAEDVLRRALALPGLAGGLGEGLVGWVALRYQAAERSGDPGKVSDLEEVLPRAAYPITEWQQRARPRPNLFDMGVHEAYEAARAFLEGKSKEPVRQGPVVFRYDDGWTVQDLNTKALLVDEGNHQHICVGQEQNGYPQRVEAGEIKVYSLRDPDGRPHVTMTWDVDKKRLTEASAESNEEIESEDVRSRCVDFGRAAGMSDAQLVLASLLPAKDANLSGASLRFANLRFANLSAADLSAADLSNAILRAADLSAADLSNADLFVANLSDANLSNANLSNANLSNANLSNANLSGANLRFANLRFANLSDANLSNANLSNANLIGANLIGANLFEADLSNTDLRGANLSGARYTKTTVWPADFDPIGVGAILVED